MLGRLEEAAPVVLSICLFSLLPLDWWVFAVLFFTPDVGLTGQLAGASARSATTWLITKPWRWGPMSWVGCSVFRSSRWPA